MFFKRVQRVMILLLVCLTGCLNLKPTMVIDDTFTHGEVAMINDAIAEWARATDSSEAHIATSMIGVSSPFTRQHWDLDLESAVMFRVDSDDPGYQALALEQETDFFGLANSETGNIMFNMDLFGNDIAFRKTLLHELGHVHQLEHTDSGIMATGIVIDTATGLVDESAVCIHQVDVDQYCAVNACGPNAGTTCR